MDDLSPAPANAGKFLHRTLTATGENRATVPLSNPDTLWFNTGTLCNIACVNCYIESSPTNDALVYLTPADVTNYLDQLDARNWGAREIGFTGGEPFMNPNMIEMMRLALARGYEVLVLTNAMRPMMRPKTLAALTELIADHTEKLTFRVSLDHWNEAEHDAIRGKNSFIRTIEGMTWLRDAGAQLAVAGRMLWSETETTARESYGDLFETHGFNIESSDPGQTVLFPEMDETVEVPEITTACWDILGKSPKDVMCASSRMVVKRKGAESPTVIACTLLPYVPEFDMGPNLKDAESDVALNHPHCAKFCVLGGASCSA